MQADLCAGGLPAVARFATEHLQLVAGTKLLN
jgi:hypothetical protein